mgnify:CR=1 FL=1
MSKAEHEHLRWWNQLFCYNFASTCEDRTSNSETISFLLIENLLHFSKVYLFWFRYKCWKHIGIPYPCSGPYLWIPRMKKKKTSWVPQIEMWTMCEIQKLCCGVLKAASGASEATILSVAPQESSIWPVQLPGFLLTW